MKSGIFEIDGVEYPDADASDPVALGWMQGSPPSTAKRIRFQDDRFLEFPQIRWSLSHMRELAPTAAIWRGNAAPSDLGVVPLDLAPSIDALAFADLHGRQLTWAQSLKETYTDGVVVLHRGRRIYERYFGALQAHRPHAGRLSLRPGQVHCVYRRDHRSTVPPCTDTDWPPARLSGSRGALKDRMRRRAPGSSRRGYPTTIRPRLARDCAPIRIFGIRSPSGS